jgi:predicted DNA-binding protein
MHIHIPDDLHSRLEHLAKETGQEVSTLVREAIETRLTVEAHLDYLLEGWTQEELAAEMQKGLESGPGRPFDDRVVEEVKTRGRARLSAR